MFGENLLIHAGDIAETNSRRDGRHENIMSVAPPNGGAGIKQQMN